MRNSKIYLIGTFPPPVHGMSLVNDTIKKKIISLGIQPFVIDLSASSLNRALYSRLFRIRKILRGLIKFIKTMVFNGGGTLYIGISGGIGQIYELPFICISRLYGKNIFVHHHSYAYLNKKKITAWLLTSMAGRKATHIVACEDMARRLKSFYSTVLNTAILSGIVAVDSCVDSDQNDKKFLRTIGFISNISTKKGIIDFLDVVSCLEKDDVKINALIAGPFQDKGTEALVMNRMSKLRTAKYVGPKYEEEKSAFYKEIDVLLFPTNYINESEGIVIHEAMSHKVPVIAKARGCIREVIDTQCGLVIRQDDDFITSAVEQVLYWASSPAQYCYASANAYSRAIDFYSYQQTKLDELLVQIISKGHPY